MEESWYNITILLLGLSGLLHIENFQFSVVLAWFQRIIATMFEKSQIFLNDVHLPPNYIYRHNILATILLFKIQFAVHMTFILHDGKDMRWTVVFTQDWSEQSNNMNIDKRL